MTHIKRGKFFELTRFYTKKFLWKASERAKQEVIHEASVLADLAPFIWCMLITRSLLSRS